MDGIVAGNWSSTRDKTTVAPFCGDDCINPEAVDAEITRYLAYLKR